MKLAIHNTNWGFPQDWISYCEQNGIAYKLVDAYSSDIVEQVRDCDVFLWHHHHILAKDSLFAKQLLFALQQSGKKVYPDFNTSWHFDDKLGQKYLLEAINAPFAPTMAFYSKDEALKWIDRANFPKVFKLRGGAGSSNVQLVKSKNEAKHFISKAFGRGFPAYDKLGNLLETWRKFRLKKAGVMDLLKSVRRLFVSTEFARVHGRERGYIMFQDYIAGNAFDIRVITIGNRAFAIKRLVRKNDFRASGSGYILYDKHEIDERCVGIAFQVTEKLKAQCLAYDFVFDKGEPLIVEINYGYAHEAYFPCPGYWTRDMQWHVGKFNSAHWILEVLIEK